MRLGEQLVRMGALDEEHVEIALRHQKHAGTRLGTVLLDLRMASVTVIATALATQWGRSPVVRKEDLACDPRVFTRVPKAWFEHHELIPLRLAARCLVVGCARAPAPRILAEVATRTGLHVTARPLPEALHMALLARHLGMATSFFKRHRNPLDEPDPPFSIGAARRFELRQHRFGRKTLVNIVDACVRPLREIAATRGIVTPEALSNRVGAGFYLGSAWVAAGHMDIRALHLALSERYGLPTLDPLTFFEGSEPILGMQYQRLLPYLSYRDARAHEVVPIHFDEREILMAVADDQRAELVERMAKRSGFIMQAVVASRLFIQMQLYRMAKTLVLHYRQAKQ